MSDDETSTQCSGAGLQGNPNNVNQYEFVLSEHMESYNIETSAVHRKLQSKIEALRILRDELEQFRIERDQYKLMAETLQLRYSALKHNSELLGVGGGGALSENSSLAALLHETREQNLKLSTEVEALKQKLYEVQGDIKLFREKEASNVTRIKAMACESTLHSKEEHDRANFIYHLENLKKKNAQLALDVKTIIDEKEEVITERDAYKCKAHRLNHELIVALKANKTHPKLLDVDGLLLENKYLRECVKNQQSDLELTKLSINKYKTMLDTRRKKGIIKLGGNNSNDETILSPRQVKTILDSGIELPGKTETIQDLKSLCLALLDHLNDKNLALSHQKKTNKILACKISELEQRLQKLIMGDVDITEEYEYAPSQLLLNGYCAATVDDEDNNIASSEAPYDAGLSANEPEPSNKEIATACNGDQSDDGMSSLSTESAHSILSSEYGIEMCINDTMPNPLKPSSATTNSGTCSFGARTDTPRISSAVAKERMEDLKDLPPHLAALVQKALHELDMRDFEAMITIRSENGAL